MIEEMSGATTTKRRPEPPLSAIRFVIAILATAVLAGILGAVLGSLEVVWGAGIGALVYAALAWLRVTNRRVDGIALVVAGAAGLAWFGMVVDGRTAPVSIGLSLRASLGFALFGLVVGVIIKLARGDRLTWVTPLLSAGAWFVGSVAALQMGTAIGYLAPLRKAQVAEGLIQGLGSSFYLWTSMVVVLIGLGIALSLYARSGIPIAVSLSIVMTVLSFNKIDFSFVEMFRRMGRLGELAADFWPPDWEWPKSIGQPDSLVILEPFIETIQIAVIGATVGVLLALPLAFIAARPTAPNGPSYWVAKSFMNVIRTVPDLFWAILFAVAVGFGQPFAGALAMIMFSLAIMAKLLSETVDAIDPGPLEAARAAGARHSQVIQYAALPQVLPNYVAYALYIFELNIRASVVIGLVGAGGIGRLLDERRNLFQWDQVMAIVIVIFVSVILIEIVSIVVRRRLV